jgi:hypothetical protein
MGGAVQKVGQAVGVDKKPSAPAPMEEVVSKIVDRASRAEEEMGARMRGARRRARGLLAQENLGGQEETLGGGNNLG